MYIPRQCPFNIFFKMRYFYINPKPSPSSIPATAYPRPVELSTNIVFLHFFLKKILKQFTTHTFSLIHICQGYPRPVEFSINIVFLRCFKKQILKKLTTYTFSLIHTCHGLSQSSGIGKAPSHLLFFLNIFLKNNVKILY